MPRKKDDRPWTVLGRIAFPDGTYSPCYEAHELEAAFPGIGRRLTWRMAKAIAAYEGYELTLTDPTLEEYSAYPGMPNTATR